MDQQQQKTIVIFGSSAPDPDSPNYIQALDLGKSLARAGYTIANGGYSGTMAATAQGAKKFHAPTIGVTCSAFGRGGPNQWIDKEIRTKNLPERLLTLINLADAFVVLPGSTGTLLEVAMAWELINKQFIAQRPIIFLSTYWQPVISTVMRAGESECGYIRFVQTQQQVLQELNGYFAQTDYPMKL